MGDWFIVAEFGSIALAEADMLACEEFACYISIELSFIMLLLTGDYTSFSGEGLIMPSQSALFALLCGDVASLVDNF